MIGIRSRLYNVLQGVVFGSVGRAERDYGLAFPIQAGLFQEGAHGHRGGVPPHGNGHDDGLVLLKVLREAFDGRENMIVDLIFRIHGARIKCLFMKIYRLMVFSQLAI